MQTVKPWIYEHYKKNLYEVIGVGHHTETLEELVCYKALYDSDEFWPNALWVRPLSMIMENVVVEGKNVPRFRYMREKVEGSDEK